ncbi:MAG TPA: clostripain-related cysteine peptidase [Chloroflexota bacterium]|nr:clostripain-related cysteine peptidase [Chloroflexota bacterium]
MTARWTFMVYMAGNNSLSQAAGEDLRELQAVGSSPEVQVLTFVKQADTGRARRLRVGKDGQNETAEDLGPVDSGNPQTVVDFIRWGVQTAPAEKYAIVLWNHGGGWTPDDMDQLYSQARLATGVTRRELNRRANQNMARAFFSTTITKILAQPSEGERQICNDDGSGHSLDTLELGNVMKLAAQAIGHPVDLLGMDACLMSTLEVAYQVQREARVIVGSEELEPGAGWCYDRVLADLAARPEQGPAELGKVVVDRYIESYRTQPAEWPVTQAAVETAKIRPFAQALDGLEQALRPRLQANWSQVYQAHARSARFVMDLVDLRTFCRNLAGAMSDAGVQSATKQVLAALQPGGYVIAEGHLGPKVKDCGGISVYFPAPSDPVSRFYKDLRFAKAHRWDRFLKEYQRAVQRG